MTKPKNTPKAVPAPSSRASRATLGRKTARWQDFEEEVYQVVRSEVARNLTSVNASTALVSKRKSYYSKDRSSQITFDVVVEAFDRGATEASLRWIWECKSYPRRKVAVEDVEEFSSKLDQIGRHNVRGTMVSRSGFTGGAIRLAQSQRISLYALRKKLCRVTCFSERLHTYEKLVYDCEQALMTSGQSYDAQDGWSLDMVIQVELRNAGILPRSAS